MFGLRVLSAFFAIALLIICYWGFQEKGLIGLGFFTTLATFYEFDKITFKPLKTPWAQRLIFGLFGFGFFLSVLFVNSSLALPLLGFGLAFYFSLILWITKHNPDNSQRLSILSLSALGFLYCGLSPGLLIKILMLPSGIQWMVFLLAFVFAGDTFAYFGGLNFGKHKLMESLSPKKTFEGALFGAVGSCITGVLVAHWLIEASPWGLTLSLCLLGSFCAQTGDLFVSLIKRVAHVKDTGSIMPGHGGIIDRLDGVYFAAPLVYFVAYWLYMV